MNGQAPSAPRSTTLFTKQVAGGKRSFFFDVKRAPAGHLYFTVSELTGQGSVWHRSRVLIPAEQAREFYQGLCDAIKAMREAEKADASAAIQAAEPKPAAKKLNRATGRASQGANRQALLAGVR